MHHIFVQVRTPYHLLKKSEMKKAQIFLELWLLQCGSFSMSLLVCRYVAASRCFWKLLYHMLSDIWFNLRRSVFGEKNCKWFFLKNVRTWTRITYWLRPFRFSGKLNARWCGFRFSKMKFYAVPTWNVIYGIWL